jgi:hypothetical protein
VLSVSNKWAELCVVRGENLLFSRSLTSNGALAGEVRRSLAVYNSQWPQQPIDELYVAGGSEQPFAAQLSALSIPVRFYDPLAGMAGADAASEKRGAFAGAVGLLRGRAARRQIGVNFVKPKQPKAERDPGKTRVAIGAAAAAVLLLSLISYCLVQILKKDKEIDLLVIEKNAVDRQLLDVEEDAKRIKALTEWTQGDVVWLDELYDLTDRVADTETIRVVSLTMEPLALTAKPGNGHKHVGRISMKGITTDDYQVVDALLSQLVADRHYRVEPKQLKRNTGIDRFRFRQEFATRFDIEKRSPEEYIRRLPARGENDTGRGGPVFGMDSDVPGGSP